MGDTRRRWWSMARVECCSCVTSQAVPQHRYFGRVLTQLSYDVEHASRLHESCFLPSFFAWNSNFLKWSRFLWCQWNVFSCTRVFCVKVCHWADGFMLVFSVCDELSYNLLHSFYSRITECRGGKHQARPPVVLIGTQGTVVLVLAGEKKSHWGREREREREREGGDRKKECTVKPLFSALALTYFNPYLFQSKLGRCLTFQWQIMDLRL